MSKLEKITFRPEGEEPVEFYVLEQTRIDVYKRQPEDTDKMVLHIDPGTAFGTGMHETTQLCIRQLRKFITPETEILDVGTGSGILAILSLMFGAKHAVGTDLDICAVEAVAQNCDCLLYTSGDPDPVRKTEPFCGRAYGRH